jgi:hypothetical protein
VSAGPRAAEDLLRKPRNSLVKRFHGQREVGGPVEQTAMSDLTGDWSWCAAGGGGFSEGTAITWTFFWRH